MKNEHTKIHIVSQKCGYYHSAGGFCLSLFTAKNSLLCVSPGDIIAFLYFFEIFLTKEERKNRTFFAKKAGKYSIYIEL